jgi:hypothetical protein
MHKICFTSRGLDIIVHPFRTEETEYDDDDNDDNDDEGKKKANGFRKTKKDKMVYRRNMRMNISKDILLNVISVPVLFIKHLSQN